MGIDTIDSSITALHTFVYLEHFLYRVSAVRAFPKIITETLCIRFPV